jgi:aminoglycoside phosphotransferase
MVPSGTWQPISIGCSGNRVFRVARPERSTCYLKIAPQPQELAFIAEQKRLEWLQGRLAVPPIEAFLSDDLHTYLVLGEVPGVMACNRMFADDLPNLVRVVAEGLRMIHAVDAARCPFDQRIDRQLMLAQQRVAQGLVDADHTISGMNARTVLADLIANRPDHEDLVFTHGDYCLPNVLIDPQTMRINGFVDWGRAGIADRYQDLALAARSLTYNFGSGWEPLLWDAYGLDAPDYDKIKFYQNLDDLL